MWHWPPVLAGAIGYEREHVQRNAGMRTHILVAIGASLVMCCGEFLVTKYTGVMNLDPARLGAQVISGIGFLCAGTIIKEGISVRGLTTASSLWCVSCIGLAAGAGAYVLAVGVAVLRADRTARAAEPCARPAQKEQPACDAARAFDGG